MKKLIFLTAAIAMEVMGWAQPDQWYVAIDPAEVQNLLSKKKITDVMMVSPGQSPVVDGKKDAVWESVSAIPYDRYVLYHTKKNQDGSYSRETDKYRTPDKEDDFSGTFRLLFDEDYLYCFLEIKDNEVNDNLINPGKQESFEIQLAPYPDSARQILGSSPYPPYSGSAPEINKKFCYWAYLGAFKFWFFLAPDGQCTSEIREKADAVKINYQARLQSCQCAWKVNDEGTGYMAEAAINLKIALADSANNPFLIPAAGQTKTISFETKVYDEDLGRDPIQASWNAEDDNVWDAMLYAGKLMIKGWTVETEDIQDKKITCYPNPASHIVFLSQKVEKAVLYAVCGNVVKSVANTDMISLSGLTPGVYMIHAGDTVLKLIIAE